MSTPTPETVVTLFVPVAEREPPPVAANPRPVPVAFAVRSEKFMFSKNPAALLISTASPVPAAFAVMFEKVSVPAALLSKLSASSSRVFSSMSSNVMVDPAAWFATTTPVPPPATLLATLTPVIDKLLTLSILIPVPLDAI